MAAAAAAAAAEAEAFGARFGRALPLRRPRSHTADNDEGDDGSDDVKSSESDDDDDDDGRGGRGAGGDASSRYPGEDDASLVRLDHERFLAAELLFSPEIVMGRHPARLDGRSATRVAADVVAHVNAVFGPNTTLLGALMNTDTASSESAHGNVGAADANDPSAVSCGGVSVFGCVGTLLQARRRCAPAHALASSSSLSRRVVLCGGAVRLRGFVERFAHELASASETPESERVVACDTASPTAGHLVDAFAALKCALAQDATTTAAAGITSYLARCTVRRAALEESRSRKASMEAHIDKVFDAMQAMLC